MGVGWIRAGETAKVGGSQSEMSSSAWWGREAADCLQLHTAQRGMAGPHPSRPQPQLSFLSSLKDRVPCHSPASFSLRSTSSYTSMASSSKSRLLS